MCEIQTICFSFWLFFRLFGLLFFVFIFLFGIFPHSRSLVKGICTVFVLAILASKLNLAAFLLYRLWVSFCRFSFLAFRLVFFLASLLARHFCIFGWLIDICLFPNLVPIPTPDPRSQLPCPAAVSATSSLESCENLCTGVCGMPPSLPLLSPCPCPSPLPCLIAL